MAIHVHIELGGKALLRPAISERTELHQLWRSLDIDGLGSIDFNEFQASCFPKSIRAGSATATDEPRGSVHGSISRSFSVRKSSCDGGEHPWRTT